MQFIDQRSAGTQIDTNYPTPVLLGVFTPTFPQRIMAKASKDTTVPIALFLTGLLREPFFLLTAINLFTDSQ